jgi:hypothetical protein
LKTNLKDVYQISDSYLDLDAKARQPTALWANIVSSMNYALLPVVSIPISLNQPFSMYSQSLIVLAVIMGLLFGGRRKWMDEPRVATIDALYFGASIGLMGFLSWLVLAHAHSLVHPHINGILIYLPFALFLFLALGQYIQALAEKLMTKHSANELRSLQD